MKKIKVSLILNIIIVFLVLMGSIFMFLGIKFMPDKTLLEVSKIEMFKFYTVDSNILMAIISFIFMIYEIKLLKGKIKEIPKKIYILKLVGTSAISLTFITTLLFLTPQYGLYAMYNNNNLFFHLIVPLLSLISYIIFEKHENSYKYALYGIIPMFIYSIYYTSMIIIHLDNGGLTFKYDFYGFLGGKISNAFIVLPVIYLVSYFISIIIILLNKKGSMYKYVILDFGKVLAYPETGKWDITKKFLELIDVNKIDMTNFKNIRHKYKDILSEKIDTLEEEYDMFFRFYDAILSEINYPNYDKTIAEKIAYDRTYNNDKYILYDGVYEELDRLKEKYTLLLLTDNWPCAISYLKEKKLDVYFDKVYISSFYGVEKKDGLFFDFPINDYNIKPGEALFIDDNVDNLEIAKKRGLDVMLMDRTNEISESKYYVINNLNILDLKK